MPSDPVSLNNLALDAIGQTPIASMQQTTGNGPLVNRTYWQVKKATLQETWWTFARSETVNGLALLSNNVWSNWEYAYQYPNDCLKVNYICNPNFISDLVGYPYTPAAWDEFNRNNPHEITVALAADGITATGSRVILSNMQNAILVYTKDVTEALMPEVFVDYLVLKLALRYALRLLPKDAVLSDLDKQLVKAEAEAKRHCANEATENPDRLSDLELSRR